MKPSKRIEAILKEHLGLWPSDTFYPPTKTDWELAIIKYLDEQEK